MEGFGTYIHTDYIVCLIDARSNTKTHPKRRGSRSPTSLSFFFFFFLGGDVCVEEDNIRPAITVHIRDVIAEEKGARGGLLSWRDGHGDVGRGKDGGHASGPCIRGHVVLATTAAVQACVPAHTGHPYRYISPTDNQYTGQRERWVSPFDL